MQCGCALLFMSFILYFTHSERYWHCASLKCCAHFRRCTFTHSTHYKRWAHFRQCAHFRHCMHLMHCTGLTRYMCFVFCMFYASRESDVLVKDMVPAAAAATISKRFKHVQGGQFQGGQCHSTPHLLLA